MSISLRLAYFARGVASFASYSRALFGQNEIVAGSTETRRSWAISSCVVLLKCTARRSANKNHFALHCARFSKNHSGTGFGQRSPTTDLGHSSDPRSDQILADDE